MLNNTINTLASTSPPNLIKEIIRFKKQASAHKLATALVTNPDGNDVDSLIDDFKEVNISEMDEEIHSCSTYARETLEYMSDKSNLIRVYPNELNERIDGGLIPGNNVLIYARPNAGKTQFAINLARGFVRDGRRVLYLINEEPKRQLLSRMISRLTGKNRTEIYSDMDAAVKMADANGLGNFFLEDINPGTFSQIRGLIEKSKPDVVVIDQLRNLDVKSDSRVNQLETAATEARNLAKRYGIVVINLTQAGDSAHNKLALEMNDVDFSNTGIPAQMDLMIGIGVNQQFRDQNMRMISIAKNKITSDHSHFPVAVDEALSKMVSI